MEDNDRGEDSHNRSDDSGGERVGDSSRPEILRTEIAVEKSVISLSSLREGLVRIQHIQNKVDT